MIYKAICIVLLAAFVAGASAALLADHEYEHLFRNFQSQHSKKYKTEEERLKRASIFRSNLDYIISENAHGRNSYTMAMNEFGDLTNEEFKALISRPLPKRSRHPRSLHSFQGEQLPTEVDWTTSGKVTPVKNQGSCGSCWAFSAGGAIEGAWAIAKNSLVSVAEQQLVDCSKQNEGCNGGLMDTAFEDLIEMGGIEAEKDYPYTARDGKCKFDKSKVAVTISGYKDVPANDNNAMMSAIAKQPVAVAIHASGMGFQFYSSGVYDDPRCPSDESDLDHGVLAVGYGTMNGKDFYKVKNSWGSSWGSKGYIYMARGANKNQCGILDMASYPVV